MTYSQRFATSLALLIGGALSTSVHAEVKNIAPFGTASQSSTAYGGTASRAIDGNTNGQFFNGSVTHTTENGTDLMPFWELTFPADFNIEKVTLWNRTDCCGERLSNLTVSVFDGATEVYNSFTTMGDFINPGNVLGSPVTIDVDLLGTVGAKAGDKIRVQRDGQPMSLAEVQVFANTNLEPFPVLEIVRQTGKASLRNNTFFPIDIAGYSIRSSGGHLSATGWLSIAENYDSNNGGEVDPDDAWLEFTNPSSTSNISEGTLGTATLPREGAPINLGNIWTPNPAEDDLTAVFLLGDGATTQSIDVQFVDQVASAADFDADGDVDGRDFLTWQRNLGLTGTATKMQGDANGDANVTGADLAIWKAQFGVGGNASEALTAAPEPAAAGMLALAGAAWALSWRARQRTNRSAGVRTIFNLSTFRLPLMTAAMVSAFAGPALAALTVDRNYRLGDDPQEHGVAGATVGAAAVPGGATLDSAGSAGDQQHLTVIGTPTYVNVTGRPMGGTGLGAHFDSGEYLVGVGLGFPSGNNPNPGVDYTGIFERGIMGWVKPDAAGLTAGLRQDVVVDTSQFQVFLDESGKFGLRHGVINLTPSEREVASNFAAQANTWYHVHLHSYGTAPGVLYVNGLAVAMVDSFYGGGVNGENLVVGANLDQTANFFSGTIDDLQVYVAGENDSMVNFGEFDILQDNPFMAQALAGYVQGDLNGDGVVQGDGSGALGAADDVKKFVDNWLFEKLIPASDLDNESILLSTGDMETRLKGDFNLDGITDLFDWGILRSIHPQGDSLNLTALLGTNVPEPSAITLSAAAAAGFSLSWRRTRLNKRKR